MEVQAIRVKCSNVKRKCKWVGTVGMLEEHLGMCKFTLVPCPKHCEDSIGGDRYFMRKDLDKHLKRECPNRDYTCRKCGEKGGYADMIRLHDLSCPKKAVPCPVNQCPRVIQRQDIARHVDTECMYAVISCKYHKLGCNVELKRKDMVAHEQNALLHLHMAIDKVNFLLKGEKVTLRSGDPMRFQLVEYQKKKENNEDIYSSPCYIFPGGYSMAVNIIPNGDKEGSGTHVSVFAFIKKGEYDRTLHWPFQGKITFILLNQLEDDNHYSKMIAVTEEDNSMVGDDWGFYTFIPHTELGHDPVKNTQYLKDDTLYFRVFVEVTDHKPWLE